MAYFFVYLNVPTSRATGPEGKILFVFDIPFTKEGYKTIYLVFSKIFPQINRNETAYYKLSAKIDCQIIHAYDYLWLNVYCNNPLNLYNINIIFFILYLRELQKTVQNRKLKSD